MVSAAASMLGSLAASRAHLANPRTAKKQGAIKARRGRRMAVRATTADPTPAVDFTAEEYELPCAPIKDSLLPDGPWKPIDGGITAPAGFKAAAFKAGLRASGTRADCALVVADQPAVTAGVFTQNRVAAAPVMYCRDILDKTQSARAILINAGQANAATGTAGMEDALASAQAVADSLDGVAPTEVLLESTGVIGQRIKMDKLLPAVPALAATVSDSPEAAMAAATAICTTDLVRKTVAVEAQVGGRSVRIGGMSKGSGMIHPNMATMLGVVTCDAPVEAGLWRQMLKRAASASFNQISVDGDTSTNDSVIGMCSGAAGGETVSDPDSPAAAELEAALTAVCVGLAKAIAWDGEGATCLIEVKVDGADTAKDACLIARSVASSSLVKSAVFGHDPNWGRVACSAGYAGIPFDQADLRIALGPHVLMEAGQPLAFDEKEASEYLRDTTAVHGTVTVDISVGAGEGSGTAWGCDLTYDYVKINAEYTT